jgi:hypothetical protein
MRRRKIPDAASGIDLPPGIGQRLVNAFRNDPGGERKYHIQGRPAAERETLCRVAYGEKGGKIMELFFWSIVGGLAGTGMMDIVETFASTKLKIRWGG